MVYIHFPSNLTEEELMLQAKYQKLKKKKKALQALKAPKQEPDKPVIKRPSDARDAREVARKLLKSGSIQPIQKATLKQDQTFKRPKGQERQKRQHSDNSSSSLSYQPFSNVPTTPDTPEKDSPRFNNLYQQIAIERDREERGLTEKKTAASANSPSGDSSPRADKRTGNTIYVSGNKIGEEYLRKHFADFGEIVHVSMEIEKGRGFVTFNKAECTEKAISEMHAKTVAGIQLQVQLARRQPQIEPINDASSSAVWSTLAASHSQKGGHKDKRELVTYDDVFSSKEENKWF